MATADAASLASGWGRTDLLECPRLIDGTLEPLRTVGVGPLHAVPTGTSRALCGAWIAEMSPRSWSDDLPGERCQLCLHATDDSDRLTPAEDAELRRLYAMLKAGEPFPDPATFERFNSLRRRDRRKFIREPATVPAARDSQD
jgi:hypothetical protein